MTRRKPRQPRTLIFAVVAGTVMLVGIGFLIALAINRNREVTPTTPQATSCCTCSWTVSLEDGTSVDLATINGFTQGPQCQFIQPYPDLGNYTPTTCVDVPVEEMFTELPPGIEAGSDAIADMSTGECTGGCYAHSSDPLLPPQNAVATDEVTLTALFELRYAVPPNDRLTEAEMIIEFPEGQESPEPMKADTLEMIHTKNENDDSNLPIKIYRASFKATWEDIMNFDEPGTYTVKYRAQNTTGTWTETGGCIRDFEVTELAQRGEYCFNLDAAPLNGTGSLNTTLTADAGTPKDQPATYEWKADLNCNGQYDEGAGADAEIFTTTENTVDRTFTHPGNTEESVSCEVEVVVQVEGGARTLEDFSDGSCKSSVNLASVPESCGNGQCDSGETCDSDGNLSCPSEGNLPSGTNCRDDCTYCGDGNLDAKEDCDPGIGPGETGYDAACTSECTLETADEPPPDEDTGKDGTEDLSQALTITQQTPDCLEMVPPNNTSTITITVRNTTSETVLVRAVSDTLPQGLSYTAGSSSINDQANPDDTGVTIESSGESQLITWNNGGSGWNIGANGTLTIAFSTSADGSATTGTHTNQVTVTPANENPIPSEGSVLVAQTCTQPETGILDNNIRYILIGSFLLIVAGTAFYTGFGTKEFAAFLDKSNKAMKDTYLRLAYPQKFMEDKIQSSALKKVDKHASKDKGKSRNKRKK